MCSRFTCILKESVEPRLWLVDRLLIDIPLKLPVDCSKLCTGDCCLHLWSWVQATRYLMWESMWELRLTDKRISIAVGLSLHPFWAHTTASVIKSCILHSTGRLSQCGIADCSSDVALWSKICGKHHIYCRLFLSVLRTDITKKILPLFSPINHNRYCKTAVIS